MGLIQDYRNKVLIAPVGSRDPYGEGNTKGPILSIVDFLNPNAVILISNNGKFNHSSTLSKCNILTQDITLLVKQEIEKLYPQIEVDIKTLHTSNPAKYNDLHDYPLIIDQILNQYPTSELYANITSGTPAMQLSLAITAINNKRIKTIQDLYHNNTHIIETIDISYLNYLKTYELIDSGDFKKAKTLISNPKIISSIDKLIDYMNYKYTSFDLFENELQSKLMNYYYILQAYLHFGNANQFIVKCHNTVLELIIEYLNPLKQFDIYKKKGQYYFKINDNEKDDRMIYVNSFCNDERNSGLINKIQQLRPALLCQVNLKAIKYFGFGQFNNFRNIVSHQLIEPILHIKKGKILIKGYEEPIKINDAMSNLKRLIVLVEPSIDIKFFEKDKNIIFKKMEDLKEKIRND